MPVHVTTTRPAPGDRSDPHSPISAAAQGLPSLPSSTSGQGLVGGARALAVFAGLAYGWTWGLGAAGALLMDSGTISESTAELINTAMGFGPLLAALVVAAALGGATLKELLASLVRWRVSPAWYLVALYGPALVAVAGAAIWYGPTALAYDRLWPAIITRYLPLALITLITAAPIQEELGWRGFALPRLQRLLGPVAGTGVLGAVWAAWHLPNVYFRGWDATTAALFLVATFLTAFPYSWLANHTRGSVLLAMLLHAGLNTSTRLASTLLPESAVVSMTAIETATYAWMTLSYTVVAMVLLAATRGRLCAMQHDGRHIR